MSKIPWRRRADLVVRPRRVAGQSHWILKDPVALRYYTLREEEYFVWSRLNGAAIPEVLCRSFAERFSPQVLSLQELLRFVKELAATGLVVADHLGSGSWTEDRRQQQARWRRLAAVNPLAIRFRGVDPDWFLDLLVVWLGGVFSRAGVLAGLVLVLSAVLLWWTHAEEFARRWPEELAQWTVRDLVSVAGVLMVVKIAHELGHGLACKRFGGEVHEIGVLLLVFTPCLYCNVTDAWLLPSKWQRMAVGAAGMWVELLLASAAGWLWWASAPGWFHAACLQVVVICAASTLIFNINPLLRYDGYYILADWLDIPNLQQQAWSELKRHVMRWCGGLATPPPADLPARWRCWLPWYAAISFVYRLVVIGLILWLVYAWLEPQGLARVAQAIALFTVVALLAGPLAQGQQTRTQSPAGRRLTWNSLGRGLACAAVVGLLASVPVPARVRAPLLLEPADAQNVYVTVEGYLEWIVPPGSFVQAGEPIARLSNPSLLRELARLEGELQAAQLKLEHLERRRLTDPVGALQLPAARNIVADLEDRLRQRRSDLQRLTLLAEQSGTVWPVPGRSRETTPSRLPGWSDSLSDAKNRGCWLTAGTLVARVAREARFEAVAYLTAADLTRVTTGQEVNVIVAAAGRPYRGQLKELATEPTVYLSPAMTARLRLPALSTAQQQSRVVGVWYPARIELIDQAVIPLVWGTGTAAIVVPPRSLGERFAAWLRETFPGWFP